MRLRVGADVAGRARASSRRWPSAARSIAALASSRDTLSATLIRTRSPDIPRRVSGYNLRMLLPENGFHVARALVGTEGTCVIVLEATLELYPAFPAAGAASCSATRACSRPATTSLGIRELRPIGCEGIDDRLIEVHEEEATCNVGHLDLLPEGQAWLLVEFGGTSSRRGRGSGAGRRRHARGRTAPPRRSPSSTITRPRKRCGRSASRAWGRRRSCPASTTPGRAGRTPPSRPTASVPTCGTCGSCSTSTAYECSLYGHFGQGCVHCRIDFDFSRRRGVAQYRRFTHEAAELVVRYGGSLSGEHGDGQSARRPAAHHVRRQSSCRRSESSRRSGIPTEDEPGKGRGRRSAATRTCGWARPIDPRSPGRVSPFPRTAAASATPRFAASAWASAGARTAGTMCPSYQVTREEMHTTRGRAHLLFEMLQGEVITDGWKSEEVKESLDLCLACKGCKLDCPVNVDMATYKAEFLSHYYEGRLRPRAAYAFGLDPPLGSARRRWLRGWPTLHAHARAARLQVDGGRGPASASARVRAPYLHALVRGRRAAASRAPPACCCGPTRSTTTSIPRPWPPRPRCSRTRAVAVRVPRADRCAAGVRCTTTACSTRR